MGHLQRLIAFDLDGTLIDSRRDLADSANELISELGGSPLPEEAVGRMVGEGARVLVQRALTEARVMSGFSRISSSVDDALARFLEIYDTRLLRHTRLYDGVADMLKAARTIGRVALLTNKPLAPSVKILEGLGIRNLFDAVTGGDGPSGRKPDPAGLHALMRDVGARPETTLLVGDSPIDHETAARAGVRCCLVSFGYSPDPFPRDRLRGEEWIAGSTDELRHVLSQFIKATPAQPG